MYLRTSALICGWICSLCFRVDSRAFAVGPRCPSVQLPLKTIVLLPAFDTGAIRPFVRLFFALWVIVLFSMRLLADPGSLDSLPTPVQNTLKSLLQDPKAAVGGVEIYQLGASLAYKVIITRDGHPFLEAHIEDTGQLVRCDPISQAAADHKAKDKDNGSGDGDQASPSP